MIACSVKIDEVLSFSSNLVQNFGRYQIRASPELLHTATGATIYFEHINHRHGPGCNLDLGVCTIMLRMCSASSVPDLEKLREKEAFGFHP